MKGTDQYIELWRAERNRIDSHAPAALNERREAAATAFERLGFPSQKVERYKYTDVSKVFAPNYGLQLATAPASPLTAAAAARYGTLADV